MLSTLRDIILDHADRRPSGTYVRCLFPDGHDEVLTYADLVARGSTFAAHYRATGAVPGSVVIIVLPHSTDVYAAFFGAMLAGYVPSMLAIPSFKLNPEHYRAELEALLGRIDGRVVVTDAAIAAQLQVTGGTFGRARILLVDDVPHEHHAIPDAAVAAGDVVLLQHSSGSTGLKKGVALSNGAVLNQIAEYRAALALTADDHIASWLPLYHDMGLIACCILPVMTAVPVTALSPLHWVTKPVSLLTAITRHGCTLTWLPNFAYEFLAARVRRSDIAGLDLRTMRGWINCSEPTIATSHRRFVERFRDQGVRAETLWTCYAMAETTFAVTQSSDRALPLVEQIDREVFQAQHRAVPAADGRASLETMSGGPVLPGSEVRIVDDAGAVQPERHVGEIAIRSTSLFSGYFKEPETTAKHLRDGWYYSGDLGYLAEGHLFITGRKKDVIIIAGKNYYPQDIERIVASVDGIYPGRVVALGHDDPTIGTQRLIVLAEVAREELVDNDDLADGVRRVLAGELDCVIDDLRLLPHMWLLKTSSGKIARSPNLQRYLDHFGSPGVPQGSAVQTP